LGSWAYPVLILIVSITIAKPFHTILLHLPFSTFATQKKKISNIPVTGSHPLTAENPLVKQPGLFPFLISFKALGLAYSTGLMKPTLFFPAFALCSLINVIILPTVGAEADVP
jgi:hypothetical protein